MLVIVAASPIGAGANAYIREELAELLKSQEPSDLDYHWETPAEMRDNMRLFKEVVDGCSWEEAPAPANYKFFQETSDYNQYMATELLPEAMVKLPGKPMDQVLSTYSLFNPKPEHRVRSNFCQKEGRHPGEMWRVHRLGAVESKVGNNNWHEFASQDVFGLDSLLQKHPTIWITALTTFPVDDNGHVLAYPPLHVHHSHFGPYRNPGVTDFIGALSFPHGDSVCRVEDGGSACFVTAFPPGHGIPLSNPMLLNAVVNDIRELNAPPMNFTLQLAIRFTLVPQKAVGLSYVGHAGTFWPNFAGAIAAGHQIFAQFNVPSDKESVVWTAFTPRASGRLLNMWLHTHQFLGYEEEWIISATPQELGLNTDVFQLSRCYDPFVPSEHALTSDDVRAHILAQMKSRSLKFRCIFNPNEEQVTSINGVEGIVPRAYERHVLERCFAGAERLEEGKTMTAVTFFSDARCLDPGLCHSGKTTVENHMHFQGFVIFDNPPNDLLQYQYANQYSSWMTNSEYETTCDTMSMLTGPDVCLWEIPGCKLPGMPGTTPKYFAMVPVLLDALLPGASGYIGVAALVSLICSLACCVVKRMRRTKSAEKLEHTPKSAEKMLL